MADPVDQQVRYEAALLDELDGLRPAALRVAEIRQELDELERARAALGVRLVDAKRGAAA